MLRKFHSISGLIATVFVIVVAVTGTILSVQPLLETLKTPAVAEQNVAELAQIVSSNYSGVESIQRTPSGEITVYFVDNNGSGEARIDAQTGSAIEVGSSAAVIHWIKELHRSLFLGESGRMLVGILAFLMIILTLTGAWLLLVRLGGWRNFFSPVSGTLSHRLHCSIGRFIVLALLLTALTGTYLSAVRFHLLPEGEAAFPEFPAQVNGGEALAMEKITALSQIKVDELEELIYPYLGDPQDFYTVSTYQGMGFVDQATGEMLSFQAHSLFYKVYEFVHRLHTGEGIWWLGLILGLAAFNVPVIAITGVLIWWRRRSALPKFKSNCSIKNADTVILVGSEGNSTWGFAQYFHGTLTNLGYQVRTTSMNQFESNYPSAKRLFILTSTYGQGDAPTSAKLFLKKLAQFSENKQIDTVVLGFGDKQFTTFCQFAKDVATALTEKGFLSPIPLMLVDRGSVQDFARWGRCVGDWLKEDITLSYKPKKPTTFTLELVDKVDYGLDIQAPTSILRFRVPNLNAKGVGRLFGSSNNMLFEPGDLVGVFASPDEAPRFYSLASDSKTGCLEICVRKQEKGICSSYLHGLSIGESIEGFVKVNPKFKLKSDNAPVVLIGAGTGIGPLIGFIRENSTQRPLYLFWGGRHPESDFLYQSDLNEFLADQRLTELNTAFSRVKNGCYVQDELKNQGDKVKGLIEQGAQVMICGGQNMASEVEAVFDELLLSVDYSVNKLRKEGTYLEDVY